MIAEIHVQNEHGNYLSVIIKDFTCSYCKIMQFPLILSAYCHNSPSGYLILSKCISKKCEKHFVLHYDSVEKILSNAESPPLEKKEFKESIIELSPDFCNIYNETYTAEQMNLTNIIGVGYRKALEFLIKDYLIYKKPDMKDDIKKRPLAQCIKDVGNDRLKEVAKRAVWIGNDETHYVRKWEQKDTSHLKGAISICLNYIESELTADELLKSMPQ